MGEICNLDGFGGGFDMEDGFFGFGLIDWNGWWIIVVVVGLKFDFYRF